jgi:hypothetical protein
MLKNLCLFHRVALYVFTSRDEYLINHGPAETACLAECISGRRMLVLDSQIKAQIN